MSNLKFKSFTWPENPQEFTMQCQREPVYTTNADHSVSFAGMGPWHRTFSGKGVFSGSSAYASFAALASLTFDAAAGTLTHPSWGSFSVYLTKLEMIQEPRDQYVAYSFTFREADSNGAIPH